MKSLFIERTSKSPLIDFNINGELKLEGRSLPEGSKDFYRPVLEWMNEFSLSAPKIITLNVKLEYFNTSSSKCILDIFKVVERVSKQQQVDAKVIWMYDEDDEDMEEAAEDYASICKFLKFELVMLIS